MLFDLSGTRLASLGDSQRLSRELAKRGLKFEDVTELRVSGCQLDDLFGIDLFKNLHTLDASHNNISLLDPLVSLDLRRVKLDHNEVEQVYVKELRNGLVVLSSDPDPDYTESFLSFGVNSGNPQPPAARPHARPRIESLDLSSNKIRFFKSMTAKKRLAVNALNLANNRCLDFSGLAALTGISRLDLSYNEECDLRSVEECGLARDCKLFLQGTPLTNEDRLYNLLHTHPNVVAHHETDRVQHARLVNPYDLRVDEVKTKTFVDTLGGFAGFVYEGETSPSELLTPRYTDGECRGPAEAKKPQRLVHLETQSTIDELENKQGTVSIHSEPGTDYGVEDCREPQDPGRLERAGQKEAESYPNQVDFLVSSMELCRKIDAWSNAIKNELFRDLHG